MTHPDRLFILEPLSVALLPDEARFAIIQPARRTQGPRWDRMSDRQMEYLAALAVLGGQSTTPRLAIALGRPIRELSWIRQELLREGDIYSVQRGQVALAVPIFAPTSSLATTRLARPRTFVRSAWKRCATTAPRIVRCPKSRPSVGSDPHAALLNPGSPSTQAGTEAEPDSAPDDAAAAEHDHSPDRDDADFDPA